MIQVQDYAAGLVDTAMLIAIDILKPDSHYPYFVVALCDLENRFLYNILQSLGQGKAPLPVCGYSSLFSPDVEHGCILD
jgi:hypothetical protein